MLYYDIRQNAYEITKITKYSDQCQGPTYEMIQYMSLYNILVIKLDLQSSKCP